MNTKLARGVRNHNPLNIEKNKNNKWQGLAEAQPDDRFCTFKSVDWGFRAAAITLIGYYDKYNLDTITKIINRWAPDFENNTTAYVSDICRRTGFSANQSLNLHEYDTLAPIIKAMVFHECGSFPYTDADLRSGLLKAGVVGKKKPLAKTGAVKASTIGAAAAGVSAVSQINDTISNAQPAIGLAQTIAEYGPAALAFVAAGAIGFLLWDYVQKRKQAS